ncbi:hypothetical protein KR074_007948 [Drosophila pseudoananassae]|nr:hypothetical protein KR074_007948 [Drosophila pseudoananassae]
MLFQHVYHKFTRIVSVLVKCAMASIYLWVLLHAVVVIPCVKERWEKRGYWTNRTRLYMSYRSPLHGRKTEVVIYLLVFWIMFGLYCRCRCNFLGSRCITQNQNIQYSKSGPFRSMRLFMVFFLFMWFISSWCLVGKYPVVIHFAKMNGSYWLYCQFIIALMFKVLVLTNFCFSYMRILAILEHFKEEDEQNEFLINDHDFGEHLNILFFA